jgi:regulator of protease activity HflC (stomatin/prohibitin superfamily)
METTMSHSNETALQTSDEPKYEWMRWFTKKRSISIGAVTGSLLALYGSLFTVSPSERANVRRMGTVEYEMPLKSGLHFKLPFVDTVDKLQISLNTRELGDIDVGTVDNQRAIIKTNYVYDIPDDAVNQLLYTTGDAGPGGIQDQVEKTVRSAAVSVFARQNMNTVNQNLEQIRLELQQTASQQLKSLYKIEVRNVQIEEVKPSEAFLRSNEDAVKAKNAAVAAENQLKTVQFQAQQAAATAKGAADAAIEQARGQAESVRLNAEADKTRLQLLGEGEQARLQAEIKAFGDNPDVYVRYLQARAVMNWKGEVPQFTAGAGTNTNLIVPLPPVASYAPNALTPGVAPSPK